MMTLGHFVTHKKNPFNEWHWILFYHQVTKVHPLPPLSKKKVPDSSTLAFLQKQKQREKKKQAQKK
jgi:hypothetical protein